jgi:hypothetical protein
MAACTLPELPYDYSALEPHYRADNLEVHHSKHHAAYVTGANTTLERLEEARQTESYTGLVGLEKTLAFNVSGHVLHSMFWQNLSPDGGGRPEGELAAAIDEHFGSFDALQAQLTQAALHEERRSAQWAAPSAQLVELSDREPGLPEDRAKRAARKRVVKWNDHSPIVPPQLHMAAALGHLCEACFCQYGYDLSPADDRQSPSQAGSCTVAMSGGSAGSGAGSSSK